MPQSGGTLRAVSLPVPLDAGIKETKDNMDMMTKLRLAADTIKRKFRVLTAGTVLCFLLFSCLFYCKSFETARIGFSLNYEEASKGLNPNGTYYSVYELKSEPVLIRALELAGVTEISAEELAQNITIELPNQYKDAYVVTQYRVVYKKNKELKSVKADDMLQMIYYAYLENFYKEYTDNREILNYRAGEADHLEYRQAASYYYTKLSLISKYLETKDSYNRSFTGENGETFQGMMGEIKNLRQVTLANFQAYVTERGLYKDREEYLQVLDYQNYRDKESYELSGKMRQLYEDCIELYDSRLTGIVLIPSVDESEKFYMSKTKTGIDHLAEMAVSAKEELEQKQETIKSRQQVRDSIESSENKDEDRTRANKMMASMDSKIQEIAGKAAALDKEYSRYNSKNYITLNLEEKGILERMNIAKSAFAAVCINMTAVFIMIYKRRGQLEE